MKMSKILNDTTRNIYLARCLFDCIEDYNIWAIEKLLMSNKADPNILIPDKGITPFHYAVGSGDETIAQQITQILLGYGGNPNVRSIEKITPVHIAAAWGRLEVLKVLLKCGGDPTLTDEEGKTALDYAKNENYSSVINYLHNILHEIETQLNYDITLDKILINTGDIVAEYRLLNKNCTNDYVSDWCNNINCNKSIEEQINENSFIHESSDDCQTRKSDSGESGILTIPSETSSDENQPSSNQYITCQSDILEKNISNSLLTSDLSTNTNDMFNITSDRSPEISIKNSTISGQEESLISVEEEYKYIDKDEDIVLIAKRILVNPKIDDNKSYTSISSKVSTLPSVIDYDTDTLRQELTSRGEPPGPITRTTKRIYLRKLKKLQKNKLLEPIIKKTTNNRVYSVELQKTLRDPNWINDLTPYKALESVIADQFSSPEPSKRWREGITKASFTYLLLDPRITLNLPCRSPELTSDEVWKTFLSAVFYVGKGKRSRPYCHLYEAVNYWKKGQICQKNCKKINYIIDIWKNNFGVVCLHIFQNVIPVEAYTREAAMINALKLQNLCNSKSGDFYGISATWPERKKRLLGVYLLYRAMLIFLNEGERQLRPDNIGK